VICGHTLLKAGQLTPRLCSYLGEKKPGQVRF